MCEFKKFNRFISIAQNPSEPINWTIEHSASNQRWLWQLHMSCDEYSRWRLSKSSNQRIDSAKNLRTVEHYSSRTWRSRAYLPCHRTTTTRNYIQVGSTIHVQTCFSINDSKLTKNFCHTNRRWGTTEEFQPGPQQQSDIYLEQSGDDYLGESKGVLRFSKLRRSDDGLYECIARNKGDSAYKVGHIAVEYAPTFEHMESLPPVYTWNEQRANLSCLAEGMVLRASERELQFVITQFLCKINRFSKCNNWMEMEWSANPWAQRP